MDDPRFLRDLPATLSETEKLSPPGYSSGRLHTNRHVSAVFHDVLIVCVGNICRSAMAEALFKHALRQSCINARIESAGLAAQEGQTADPLARELLRERGIDIRYHRARQLTPNLVTEFDLVLTMDSNQIRAIESILPSARGRVHRLGKWSDFDIPDPYKKPREVFERALALIDQGLMDWKNRFWA